MPRRLLVNDFVDPLGWLTENGACIDAKLGAVRLVDGNLLIELSYHDEKMTTTLSEQHLKSLTLSQTAKILSEYRDNYLLRALARRVTED